MSAPRVLVVDSDVSAASELAESLVDTGHVASLCHDRQGLATELAAESWDAVILDQDTADIDDLGEVLSAPEPPVLLLLAAFGSIDDAVAAVRAGASDYLSKPVAFDQLRVSLEGALERRELRAENRRLREDLDGRFELDQLKSRSPVMKRVFDTVRTIADTRATVLIQGESGTGKTLLARSIHRHSSRASRPFIEVNCGALPDNLLESELFGHVRGAFTGAVKDRPGKFEAADGGTLFLDEIACASTDLQMKLLRVLQDREFERLGDTLTRRVDVRVIAATNAPLDVEVAEGRFREDLFYRLNVLGLSTPPLRERPGDVLLLAEHFLTSFCEEYERDAMTLSPEVASLLASHTWPGNVRELENSIERAVLLSSSDTVRPEALPAALQSKHPALELPPLDAMPSLLPLREAVESTEKSLIQRALLSLGGSRKETAAALGVNRTTLFNKMKKYNLMDFVPEAADDPTP